MSISDLALHYGTETTYGTAVALTRSYETQVDDWKAAVEFLQSQGFVGGQHTIRSKRSVAVQMGAAGSVQVDVLTKGMGLLMKDMSGTFTAPTQQGATIAYLQTFSTASTGPTRSATIQALRTFVDGGTQAFTHAGCVCKGWELNCEASNGPSGFLNLKSEWDAQSVSTIIAAGSNNYVTGADPFNWQQGVITLGGSAFDMRKVNLKCDYKMNTDRRFLRGASSYLKKKPRLGDIPEITGELEGEFDSLTQYNHFINGDIFTAQFQWTGALIVSGHNYQFTVDLPAIQYNGESPEASLTESPKQTLPFVVLHDDTIGPAVTISYKSIDTLP
jgi:Phage tail tube protein